MIAAQIVCGHARAEAAKLIGLKYVPVIRLSHLSDTEIRVYMLADNKLAEKAGWDREILALCAYARHVRRLHRRHGTLRELCDAA
jgi:ParB-like chromosome segregation protein Spo0J